MPARKRFSFPQDSVSPTNRNNASAAQKAGRNETCLNGLSNLG
jgi:hypothetical protein